MKKVTKKKKNALLVIFIIILIIAICGASIVLTRYNKYKSIMGTYELVSGESNSPLVLDLYKWSKGNKDDLKCDLWNCSGYTEGTIYYIKDNVIQFRYDKHGSYDEPYKLYYENDETYLVFTDTSSDGVINITKWKKVK